MSLYVSVSEFKQSPTAVDTSQLDQTAIGNQKAQDNALLLVLRRASKWVDNICRMPTSLEATVNTETKITHVGRKGIILIQPDNVPIVQLQSVKYRIAPNTDFIDVDLTYVEAFERWFQIYNINTNTINPALVLQPYSVGYASPYRRQVIEELPLVVQYTYVNGYFNSVLSVASKAGDASVTVDKVTGLSVGSTFTLYDSSADYTEECMVQSINGNVVQLTEPLLFDHAASTPASAIPDDVKQATILLAGHLIKNRGSSAVVMTQMGVQSGGNTYVDNTDEVCRAKELLGPYTRMITT